MSAQDAEPVLRRKAAALRARPAVGPERAMKLALGRGPREAAGLDVHVAALTLAQHSLSELLELPPEKALLAMLEGPGDALGLAALSSDLVAALVEALTTGSLLATKPDARKPTRVDAAMCAGVIDLVLADFEHGLEDSAELGWAGGYRYASFLDGPHPLPLLLEDISYRIFSARLSLSGDARQGDMLICLPARPRAQRADGEGGGATTGHWRGDVSAAVMAAPAALTAVLERREVPLSDAMAFAPGTLLTMPMSALDTLSLEGADGAGVATGRLGQSRGFRAVRLAGSEGPPGPAMEPPQFPAAVPEADVSKDDAGAPAAAEPDWPSAEPEVGDKAEASIEPSGPPDLHLPVAD